jgi:hypothetical protein
VGQRGVADVIAEERLWRTEDGERLVREGDPAARFLAYAPGHEIAKGDEDKVPGEESKAKPAPANKARRKSADK